jgi:CelD/BcsL family acetyltransferase involved in cellulose biosynthesis
MPSKETNAVVAETFESLASFWLSTGSAMRWDCLFVLPAWLEVWWDSFGAGLTRYLCSVRHGEELLGIAPLMVQGEKASFMGSSEVCDYLDFVVLPGKEPEFFRSLLEHLIRRGITCLDLGPVRPDSTVLTDLLPLAESLGYKSTCEQEDVSLELDLPESWEEFLSGLSTKERHEVRRKLRRLEDSACVRLRVVDDLREVAGAMEIFLKLMSMSRPEKAAFLTTPMAAFFCSLAEAMTEVRMLKMFFLDLNDKPAAAALCFDHHASRYLYNSGYDPQFRWLSAGLLNKIFSIRESIERGQKKYDFLKGAEIYKFRLGGKPIPLYRCQVQLR